MTASTVFHRGVCLAIVAVVVFIQGIVVAIVVFTQVVNEDEYENDEGKPANDTFGLTEAEINQRVSCRSVSSPAATELPWQESPWLCWRVLCV